jgi:hypothetical protein
MSLVKLGFRPLPMELVVRKEMNLPHQKIDAERTVFSKFLVKRQSNKR